MNSLNDKWIELSKNWKLIIGCSSTFLNVTSQFISAYFYKHAEDLIKFDFDSILLFTGKSSNAISESFSLLQNLEILENGTKSCEDGPSDYPNDEFELEESLSKQEFFMLTLS